MSFVGLSFRGKKMALDFHVSGSSSNASLLVKRTDYGLLLDQRSRKPITGLGYHITTRSAGFDLAAETAVTPHRLGVNTQALRDLIDPDADRAGGLVATPVCKVGAHQEVSGYLFAVQRFVGERRSTALVFDWEAWGRNAPGLAQAMGDLVTAPVTSRESADVRYCAPLHPVRWSVPAKISPETLTRAEKIIFAGIIAGLCLRFDRDWFSEELEFLTSLTRVLAFLPAEIAGTISFASGLLHVDDAVQFAYSPNVVGAIKASGTLAEQLEARAGLALCTPDAFVAQTGFTVRTQPAVKVSTDGEVTCVTGDTPELAAKIRQRARTWVLDRLAGRLPPDRFERVMQCLTAPLLSTAVVERALAAFSARDALSRSTSGVCSLERLAERAEILSLAGHTAQQSFDDHAKDLERDFLTKLSRKVAVSRDDLERIAETDLLRESLRKALLNRNSAVTSTLISSLALALETANRRSAAICRLASALFPSDISLMTALQKRIEDPLDYQLLLKRAVRDITSVDLPLFEQVAQRALQNCGHVFLHHLLLALSMDRHRDDEDLAARRQDFAAMLVRLGRAPARPFHGRNAIDEGAPHEGTVVVDFAANTRSRQAKVFSPEQSGNLTTGLRVLTFPNRLRSQV